MIIRALHFFLVSILAIGLVGCGATGTRFENLPLVKARQGVLVVYRPYDAEIKTDFTLLLDNHDSGDLKKNGYRYFSLNPGKHWLEVKGPNTIDFYVAIVSGQYCFVRLKDGDIGNVLSGIIAGPYVNFPIVGRQKYISIQQVSRNTALPELKYLRYSQQAEKKGNHHGNH